MSGLYKDPEGKEIFKKSMVSSHPSNTIKGSEYKHDESEVLDLKERIKKLESEAKDRDVSSYTLAAAVSCTKAMYSSGTLFWKTTCTNRSSWNLSQNNFCEGGELHHQATPTSFTKATEVKGHSWWRILSNSSKMKSYTCVMDSPLQLILNLGQTFFYWTN